MIASVIKERNTKPKRGTKPVKANTNVRAPVNKDHINLVEKIAPLNEAQRQMMFALNEGANVVAYGSAGTGKSYLACYFALQELLSRKTDKIVIVRSAVQSREMGFLPGSLDEKADPYKIPYKQIINELCHNGTAFDVLVKKGMLEFITTSYVRGITLNDSIVIVDEFQNMNINECYSVLTRVGKNTQIVLLGDTKQTDLNQKREDSCFDWVLNVTQKMPNWFDLVHFYPKDIVRSDFVRELIIIVEG